MKDGQEIILFFTMQAVNAITDLETYLSVLATIVTFLPAVTEENTAATLLARTIEQLFKTIHKHDCRQFEPKLYLVGSLFKELLLESHTGTYFE